LHENDFRVTFGGMTCAAPPEELTYTVRPALLRRGQEWRLRANQLSGPQGSLDLATVREAALIQMRIAGVRIIRLDLVGPQTSARIQLTTSVAPRPVDAAQQSYLTLISEIGTRLSVAVPELTYRMEASRRVRLMTFVLGALVVLGGIGLTGLAFLTYVDHWPSLLASLPLLVVMKLFGAVLMYRSWPLRRSETFAIATLPFILWTMGGPRPEIIPPDPTA
jgi:hypothetical protein